MSFITWDTEERVSFDPWTQQPSMATVTTGWTCTCGAKSGRPKRTDTTFTTAASHLMGKHGAPFGGDCPCGYVERMADHGDDIRGHIAHHERWVVEVWDA